MNIIKQGLAAVASLCLATLPASAQWIYQEQGSAFSTSKTHIAVTALNSYGFGLRCSSISDLTVIFITPEQADEAHLETMNALLPQILVRVDDKPIHEIAATVTISERGLSLFADAPLLLRTELQEARAGISVAIRVSGTLFHEIKFNAIGSTSSVDELDINCSLPAS